MSGNTIYECVNESCVLGSRKSPGSFTGGMSSAQRNLLYGDPEESMVEGEHYGDGVCPACGELGEVTDNEHVVVEKAGDPFQDLHDKVAGEVADPTNTAVTADTAQARLIQLVNERQSSTVVEEDDPDA